MQTLLQDLHHASRALLKRPGYLITALVTLALGIGFSTATFSVIYAVILRPLPYDQPEQLVRLIERNLPRFPQFSVSSGHYLFWRERASAFEGIAALRREYLNVDTGSGDPERVTAIAASGNLFDVLGVQALYGRALTPADELENNPRVAVLSHDAWTRRFGGDRGIVGKTVRIDRQPVIVAGIMPPTFRYPNAATEMWIPLVVTQGVRNNYGSHNMTAIARLKPGVTLEQADADMRRVSNELIEENPGSKGWEVLLFDLQAYAVTDVRQSLLVLLGAVTLVLLIACANVANLLLARGASRHKELAIRSSIGATRWRLLRQLLVEQLTLALVSTAAGVLVAAWLLRVLLAMMPNALPAHADVKLDAAVLGFAVALAFATPMLFGLLPALQASRPDVRALLSAGGRQGSAAPAARTRTVLVVAEIALAMTLLVGAALLLRSFVNLANQSPGFSTQGAFTAGISLPTDKYPEGPIREGFLRSFLERIEALPQVSAAGLTRTPVMGSEFNSWYEVEGEQTPPEGPPLTLFYGVSEGFFDVMQIPVLRGRVISSRDSVDTLRVAVISQALADRHFAGVDPIGRRIRVGQGRDNAWREIVGVVANVKQAGLDEQPRAQVYESYQQHPYFSEYSLVVRTTLPDPVGVVPQVRAVLRSMDAELPLAQVRTLEDVVDATIRPHRFSTTLIAAFGAVALLLAAVGLYGVIAYTVGLRRQEFAIRVAHGASSRDILQLVLRGAAMMAVGGIAIGLVAAWILRGVVESLLFNVSVSDPAIYATVAALLAATALLASAVPALRATRVDPAVALRGE